MQLMPTYGNETQTFVTPGSMSGRTGFPLLRAVGEAGIYRTWVPACAGMTAFLAFWVNGSTGGPGTLGMTKPARENTKSWERS